jgi:hypothetical protein
MPPVAHPMLFYQNYEVIPLALDLSTCVYNSDKTRCTTSITGSGGCDYGTDGDQAWVFSVNNGAYIGINTADYICPGGTVVNNGNNIAAVVQPAFKFSSDGTKLLVRELGVLKVYTLATPYLMSSKVLFSSNNTNLLLDTLDISWDGMSIYGLSAAGVIRKYTLPSAWDISSRTDTGQTVSVGGIGVACVRVSRDESRIYVLGLASTDRVYEYVMATPGNLTTIPTSAGTAVPNFTLNVQTNMGGNVSGISVSYDQTHLLVSGALSSPTGTHLLSYTGTAIT